MSNTVTVVGRWQGQQLDRGLDSTGSKVGRLGTGVRTALAATGVIAGVRAIGGAVRALSDNASNAQQAVGATETVFGQFAGKVGAYARNAANDLGLSNSAYREQANLIGSLFRNQGVATDELAGKTRDMIGVAADLASVYGGDTKSAVEALGSAFKGEFDPLERYGISIKQSAINAELAARGQDRLTGSALKQAQQIATTDLILKQSAATRGNFARETDTMAGQQQRASATLANISGILGSAFVPAFTSAFRVINTDVLPPMQALAEQYAPQVGQALGDLAERIGPKVGQFLGSLPGLFGSLNQSTNGAKFGQIGTDLSTVAQGIGEASAALPSFTDTLSVASVVTSFAADNIDKLGALLPYLAVGYGLLKVSQLASNVAQAAALPTKVAEIVVNRQLVASNRALIAARAANTGATTAGTVAENVGTASRSRGVLSMAAHRVALLASAAAGKVAAAGQWLLNAALTANPIGLVIAAIAGLVAIFVIAYKRSDTFRKIVNGAWASIKATTAAVWPAIRKAISIAILVIVGTIRGLISMARAMIDGFRTAKDRVVSIWTGLRASIRDRIEALVGFIRGLPQRVIGIFSGASSWLRSAGQNVINGFMGGIRDMAGRLVETAREVVGNAVEGAKNLLGIASPSRVFMVIGRQTGEGLVIGVNSQARRVSRAARDLSANLAGGFATPRLASSLPAYDRMTAPGVRIGTGGNGGGPVVINVNVAPGANPVETGRQVARALDAYYRAGGQVVTRS